MFDTLIKSIFRKNCTFLNIVESILAHTSHGVLQLQEYLANYGKCVFFVFLCLWTIRLMYKIIAIT